MPLDLDNMFQYHPPTPEKVERYNRLRVAARVFAQAIVDECPECSDQTAAVRKVSEAVMTANAGIARNP